MIIYNALVFIYKLQITIYSRYVFIIEQMHLAALSEREKETSQASETREVLEKQMEMHREQHQKQLQSLRDEISEKQATVDNLKE